MDAFQEYFVDIVKNHYADFEGRARRKEYWMFYLFSVLVAIAVVVVAVILISISESLAIVAGLLYIALALGLLLPSLAVAVRRLHDTDRSGWWYLVSLVPFIGGFILLYFMVIEGDAGPNAYGPDPKDPYPEGAGIDEFAGVLDR
ncbi:DUF805 domain-containing protein [Rubrivirga sp. S365]|uniref:DUF805 domain-containing protein n=1 Tax=Rubrivirga litoralis TaxID=3075598 RepID=A0ABU3BQL2_9BACT|nr:MULTISPECIES: DUF805 domain-containing protein [unclassified Rubrivirga]MDT0631476.1 DUF805 domain-containing protein [Rubrivirga sp. F394]MDT7855542.1 DUF805 domain-containing protein [Rubrivirga sp. S365]